MKICQAFTIQSVDWTYHIGPFIQEGTEKQGQNDCYEKEKGFTLAVDWEGCKLCSQGLLFKLLLTLNSFLPDRL